MRVLVTGASGFVGHILSIYLLSKNVHVCGTLLATEATSVLAEGVEPVVVESFGPTTPFENALKDVDVVIHLAARVHIMKDTATDPLHEFCKVNCLGTERLARQAAQIGVKRFVFLSTIGVNGDNSGDKPYTERDIPHPHNHYSVSKYEAELALQRISQETGMEVVIIRSPLVYGPGNPGNFLTLLRIVSKGIPLPLGFITNRRSLIYVGNLVDALVTCATHPAAAGETYLVSDGEDVSLPELIKRTAKALSVPARLFPVPVSLMRMAGKLTGKSGAVNRLTGSLTVDSSKIQRELGWKPPYTMDEGLKVTAEWFKKQKNN
ncbi:MAG: SDR family oxidoreductase [Chlorobium sp.]|nr:SDR family oxidoreductase [Chlorobium sp.]